MRDRNDADGVIAPTELYTLQTFCSRLGVKPATLRAARRAGLKVYYVHKHAYIYGHDWIEYVRRNGGGESVGGASAG